jgi:hypothetical protein
VSRTGTKSTLLRRICITDQMPEGYADSKAWTTGFARTCDSCDRDGENPTSGYWTGSASSRKGNLSGRSCMTCTLFHVNLCRL